MYVNLLHWHSGQGQEVYQDGNIDGLLAEGGKDVLGRELGPSSAGLTQAVLLVSTQIGSRWPHCVLPTLVDLSESRLDTVDPTCLR